MHTKLAVAAAALAIGLAAPGVAQTLRAPALPEPGAVVLIDHDEGEHGHGRKLGHFKRHGADEDEDQDEDGAARRSTSRSRSRSTAPQWSNPAPYTAPPGYGYAYPTPYGPYAPPPYGAYPPPYYRGY
jgi:hypothetical protein